MSTTTKQKAPVGIAAEHALSSKAPYGTSVRVSWGLIQIPVRLYTITDDERSVPARKQFTEDGHQIGSKKYDKTTGLDYDGEVIKKVEVGPDVWVELTDEEIESQSTLTKGLAEIACFTPESSMAGHYMSEKVGVWRPDTMKSGKERIVDPSAAKAASLLSAAMAKRGVAALVMVPSRSGGQYVSLHADGTCRWLCFAENVRRAAPADFGPVDKNELALAEQLIDSIGVDEPVLLDEVGGRIREFLAVKASDPEAVSSAPAPAAAQVMDLAGLLAASLQKAS